MTAYAESDYNGQARSKNPTSSGYYSEGLFQQTLPWWTNDHWDSVAATAAFIGQFRNRVNVPVEDCYFVQRWQVNGATVGSPEFYAAKETINYTNRLERVKTIIATGKLP